MKRFSSRGRLWVLACVLVVVSGLPYLHVLGYSWTGPDTYSLILSGRIEAPSDVLRIFSEPLMARAKFYPMYYRPLTTLTFSLDDAIWGMNPFGYHLTDLLLHIGVAVTLFFLVRSLHPSRTGTAWLAGGLLALHPRVMEIVPGIERRQDLLVMLLMTAALLAALRGLRTGGRSSRWRGVSAGLFLLALLSKEMAMILLPLLGWYLYLFEFERGSVRRRLVGVLHALRDHLLVGGAYLAAWFYVGGTTALSRGGIARQFIVRDTLAGTLSQLVRWGWYRVYLGGAYPFQPWWGELQGSVHAARRFWTLPAAGAGLASALALLATLGVLWRARSRLRERVRGLVRARTVDRLQTGLMALALPAWLFVVVYPGMIGAARLLVRRAYGDPGLPILTGMMEAREVLPLARYLRRTDVWFRWGLEGAVVVLGAAGATGLAIGAWRNRKRLTAGFSARDGKWAAWYLGWWLLPGMVYTAGLNFAFRLVYPALLPLSVALAFLLAGGVRSLAGWIQGDGGRRGRLFFAAARGLHLMVALFVVGGIVRFSPLLEPYPEWDCAQKVGRMYRQKLAGALAGVPAGGRVRLERAPKNIVHLKPRRPRVHSAGIFGLDSLSSWLRITGRLQGRRIRIVDMRHVRRPCPGRVRITETSPGTLRASWGAPAVSPSLPPGSASDGDTAARTGAPKAGG